MWYYVDNGQQQGPFNEAQFDSLIAAGTINPATYVWKEGQPNWLPLAQARNGAVGSTATCQVCHQPVGADNLIELNGVRVCAACKPVALQTMREGVGLGEQVFVEGKKIITRDGAEFPHRCIRCNASVIGAPMKRNIYWHHPLYFLLIFTPYLGIIAYVIVAIIVRKRATINIHVCPTHRQRRIYAIIFTLAAILGGFVSMIIAVGAKAGALAVLGSIALIIAGIVVGIIWGRLFRIARITKEKTVWLKGVGREFAASLPPWKGEW